MRARACVLVQARHAPPPRRALGRRSRARRRGARARRGGADLRALELPRADLRRRGRRDAVAVLAVVVEGVAKGCG
eukprot:623188-Alexandrium_andersonii.AAC.1